MRDEFKIDTTVTLEPEPIVLLPVVEPPPVEPGCTAEQYCLAKKIKWYKAGGFLAEAKTLYPGKTFSVREWEQIHETFRNRPVVS
jgi:hypothetical protein